MTTFTIKDLKEIISNIPDDTEIILNSLENGETTFESPSSEDYFEDRKIFVLFES